MLLQHQYVNVLHSITARIASCIDRAIPYANVIGVDTMAELEGKLTDLTAPISLSTALFENSTNPVSFDAGCFIGGAGVNIRTIIIVLFKILPYSRKYWRGIIFGGLAVSCQTASIKSANIMPTHGEGVAIVRNRQIYICQLQFSSFSEQSAKYYSRHYIRLYGRYL